MSSNSPMSFLANETEDRIDDIYNLCCEILPADLANLVLECLGRDVWVPSVYWVNFRSASRLNVAQTCYTRQTIGPYEKLPLQSFQQCPLCGGNLKNFVTLRGWYFLSDPMSDEARQYYDCCAGCSGTSRFCLATYRA